LFIHLNVPDFSVFQFTCLYSKLVGHEDHQVRHELLSLFYIVYKQCSNTIAPLIEDIMIDLIQILITDPYDVIGLLSRRVHNYLMLTMNEKYMDCLKYRLHMLSVKIPREATVKGDVEKCLKQLLGVLINMNSLRGSFLLVGETAELLIVALSSCLQLNIRRVSLNREVIEAADIFSLLDDLPLSLDTRKGTVAEIAIQLIKNEQAHANCISAIVANSERSETLSGCYHLAAYFLQAFSTTVMDSPEKFIDTLQVLVEQSVALLQKIDIHPSSRDDFIEDDNYEQCAESCLATILLSFCAAAFTCTPSIFVCQKLMIQSLFEIFKWTGSSYSVCAESAEYALKAAVLAAREVNISSLCLTYAKYLLPKVAICCRTYDNNLRAPCVLSSLLDHCDSCHLFDSANHAVQELLGVVDSGSQKWLILILKALLSFQKAVGIWFSDVKPEEVQFNQDNVDEKAVKPDFVESVNTVSKRTQHLLFCSHIRIRILVLKILDSCMKNLRHFPDDHLPMIHHNWPAILDCLVNEDFSLRVEAFKVLRTMCEISGSFCYRRIIPSVWPSVREFMICQGAKSVNAQRAYLYSSTYKYQEVVLENLGVIFRHIEPNEVDWKSVMMLASVYCDDAQPEKLKHAAESLLSLCEEELHENV
uniref:Non-specific serine/threonine protein kinase n=1 Tax=Thelazia callipaeda TaxID=103827 RepID=A0A0N5D7C6_THECL